MADAQPEIEYVLSQTVFIRGENRAFGELTLEDARARADELRAMTGFGPTARVAPVARGWRELSLEMERAAVGTVGELPPELVIELARKVWVLPPGGSLL